MYKYYSLLRPVSIGTYPKKGMQAFKNYDYRQEIAGIGRAWGELFYDRKLTDKEISSYDLAADAEENRNASYGEIACIQDLPDAELIELLNTLYQMDPCMMSELEYSYLIEAEAEAGNRGLET